MRWRAAGAALAAVLLLAAPVARATEAVKIDTARAIAASAARPADVDFAAADAVRLPDNWRRTRAGFAGVVWYEVALDPALAALGTREGLALTLPRMADGGDLWLNGERLDVRAAGEFTRNRTPWIDIPPQLLKEAGNRLLVRVRGSADARGGLSELALGGAAALRPGYELRRLFQNGIPQTLTFSVVICVFGAIPLWLKTRRRMDFLFALLCIAWLPRALLILAPSAGTPSQWGMLLAHASTLLSNALIVVLMLEHSRWQGPFWDRYLRVLWGAVVACFAAGALLAALGEMRPTYLALLLWPYFSLALVPVGAQVRQAWRTRRRSDVSMAVTLVAWCVAVVHDFGVGLDKTAFDALFWAPTAALLVLLNLIWRTLESLALKRGTADHEISQAVAEERQAVLLAERNRLLHDLHDGLGSQLITALRMTRRDEVPREEVARVIEDSLEDMRLIIDSLDLEEHDLLPLLGNLRYRLEPRLNALGVALHWDVEVLPELDYLSPETGLSIVRIVQESVNNAVRHGGARNITVRVRAAGDRIELTVADDGRGFDPEAAPAAGAPRRGLAAMRMRAQKLGGALALASGESGTQVTLALPLQR